MIECTCNYCETVFLKHACHAKRAKKVYCSLTCSRADQEVKVTVICKHCNQPFQLRPSEISKITTCSRECSRASRAKQENPNWRGGVTSDRKAAMETFEYKNWRMLVFSRDDYTCQMCSKRGGNLEADHIKPWAYFPKLRYNVDNGRTLCRLCHHSIMKEVFKWRKVIKAG